MSADDSTHTPTRREPTIPPTAPAPARGLAIVTALLAGGLVATTLLGPLVSGVLDYGLSRTLTNQLVGLEVVTLLLVVPVALLASWLTWLRHPAGPILAIGPAGYAAYMLVQYMLGPEYGTYQPAQVLHLVMFVLALVVGIWGWTLGLSSPLPTQGDAQRRARAVILLGLAGFIVLRYLPGLVGSMSDTPISAEFADAPTFFWSIWLLDLGVVVPATVAAAVGLLRERPVADLGLYAVVGWYGLVPVSVAAMAGAMLVDGDPNASIPTFVLLTVASAVFLAFAVTVLHPLLRLPAPEQTPGSFDPVHDAPRGGPST